MIYLRLRELSINFHKVSIIFDFTSSKHLDQKYQIDIKAYNDTINMGLKHVEKGKYEWRLTKAMWHYFTELLRTLHQSGVHGHQYLDPEEGDIDRDSLQVIFSLDEYPLSLREEHFEICNS